MKMNIRVLIGEMVNWWGVVVVFEEELSRENMVYNFEWRKRGGGRKGVEII